MRVNPGLVSRTVCSSFHSLHTNRVRHVLPPPRHPTTPNGRQYSRRLAASGLGGAMGRAGCHFQFSSRVSAKPSDGGRGGTCVRQRPFNCASHPSARFQRAATRRKLSPDRAGELAAASKHKIGARLLPIDQEDVVLALPGHDERRVDRLTHARHQGELLEGLHLCVVWHLSSQTRTPSRVAQSVLG
jgi:hypothetical protein